MPNKRLTQDDNAKRVQECLKQAYNYVSHDFYGDGSAFDKAERAEKMFRGIINPREWIPQSEVFLPFARALIETSVPTAINYIFSQEDLFRLRPINSPVPPETISLVEKYLEYDIIDVMNMRYTAIPTIQDAFKLGVGYGMISHEAYTPSEWQQVRVMQRARRRIRTQGRPSYRLRYEHLPFATVFPSPHGDGTPEGQEFTVIIRFHNIDELIALQEADGNGFSPDIDWQAIREDAIDRKITQDYTGAFAFARNMISLGAKLEMGVPGMGIDYEARNVPLQIPMIEMYSRREHVWIANGQTTIYHVSSDHGDLFNPIVKCQIENSDARWFQAGLIEKNYDVFDGTNLLFNGMLDALDWQLRPRYIKDTSTIPGSLQLEPYGVTHAQGDPTKGLQQLSTGQFDQGVPYAMQVLQQARNVGTGHEEQLQGGASPGMVRGGMAAFESLLETTGARDKFCAEMAANGFFRSVIMKTLQMEQLLIGQRSRKFSRRATDPKRKYEMLSITEDDLRHDMEVKLHLSERLKEGMADRQIRMNAIQLIGQNPAWARQISPAKAIEFILGSKDQAERLTEDADPQNYDQIQQFYKGEVEGGGGEGQPGMGGAMQGMMEGGRS